MKGYHLIEVEESSREKTAFTAHIGLFQYIRLPFGLTIAPASFQRLLEHVPQDFIGKFLILYIDDILIFSASFEDHLSHVAQVLQTLRQVYLKERIDRCQFAWNSVEFLSHLITPEGTGPKKQNIEAATSFPTPDKIKDVRAFLDLCNYYRWFIKNYSVFAGPLLQLLKKTAAFRWHSPQHESFLTLKERLTAAPILGYPDFSILFTLYTDACGDSIGFNLTQVQHGKERASAYWGRNFSDTEKKYSVTEREALSVIVAIQKCRLYLLGNHSTVVVDHQALKWLMSLCDPTGRLALWTLTLQGYDFTIQYRPGKDHANADVLSRRVYTIFQQPILPQTSTEELRNAQIRDDKLQPLIPYLQDGTLPKDAPTAEKILRQEGQYFLSDNNILYRQSHTGKRAVIHLVVPKTLQTELLNWCHDHFTSGHLGLTKTYKLLRSTYFWNNMFADLQWGIKSCVTCSQKKKDVHHSKPPLLPIVVSGPWEVIAADCTGPLPAANLGNRYILIIGDLFTKYIETAALLSIETTINTQLFLHKIVFWHGPPHRFLTGRGTNFTSKMMAQLFNDLNINKVFTSSYHPQYDGFVERINGVIM